MRALEAIPFHWLPLYFDTLPLTAVGDIYDTDCTGGPHYLADVFVLNFYLFDIGFCWRHRETDPAEWEIEKAVDFDE